MKMHIIGVNKFDFTTDEGHKITGQKMTVLQDVSTDNYKGQKVGAVKCTLDAWNEFIEPGIYDVDLSYSVKGTSTEMVVLHMKPESMQKAS